MSKFRLTVLILGLGALMTAVGCGPKPVAKVDGIAITREEFVRGLENGVGLRESFNAGKQTLDMLIVMRLVEKDAKDKGITLSEEDLKKAMAEERKRIQASTGESYEETLKKAGIGTEDFERQKRFDMLLERLVVTNSRVEEFFKTNARRFDEDEKASYLQLVVPTKDAALAALKEVSSGKQDFAKIAAERSLPGSPSVPQQIAKGAAEQATGEMKPIIQVMEKQVFATPEGTVSQPFQISVPSPPTTPSAAAQPTDVWVIVKVLSRTPAKKATLENSRDQVRKQLLSQMMYTGEVQQYLTSLRAKARLEIVDPNYSSLKDQYEEARKAMPTFKPPKPEEMIPPDATPPGGGK